MPEIKDGQFNINLKWFEFEIPGDLAYTIWINFERVIWVKCDNPGASTSIEIGYEENPELLEFGDPDIAFDIYNKMRSILNVINVRLLSPQNS